MTRRSQLKARVRARMAVTGESYVTALRHVTGSALASRASDAEAIADGSVVTVDHGYALRGGLHPLSANVAHVLAHHGIVATGESGDREISEALAFGVSGGVGAGYILWEFKEHGAATLVMGFNNSWQYPDRWHDKTLRRLGVRYTAEHSGAAARASRRLWELLETGRPCIIRPDRYGLGYWRMPSYMDGRLGGPDIVAYAVDDDRVWVDDRNVSPLSVTRKALDAARARVGSYRNSLYVIDPESEPISADRLRGAIQAGLEDTVEHLSSTSESFSLPAWRKWSRMLTDRKGSKAWPNLFGEGENGLAGVLISIWEQAMPAGGYGGHLRDLYADFLEEAADLLEYRRLLDVAATFRRAGSAWHEVAHAAIPAEVPALARLRELTVAVHQAVADPASVEPTEADGAAAELWDLREELDGAFPLGDGERLELFAELSARVDAVHEIERAAVSQLAAALDGTGGP